MVHGAVADRTLPAPGVAAEEDGWTLAEEHEDIQDDVTFADGAWNENAAVFEQKDPLDTVLALDADDAAPVEDEAVDFPEVDADRKDEATLRDAVAEEVLAPAGPRHDAPCEYSAVEFQASYVSTRALVDDRQARPERYEGEVATDDPDACAAQEERRSSWRLA